MFDKENLGIAPHMTELQHKFFYKVTIIVHEVPSRSETKATEGCCPHGTCMLQCPHCTRVAGLVK